MQELPWPRLAVALPLGVVAAVFSWWGWESGAYFGVVFLPGTVILLVLLGMLLLFGPWTARLEGGTRVALVALLGLAAWTLISGLWSPTAETAVADAQRAVGYAVLFALGLWACLLLGRRLILAVSPVAFAGAVVAIATMIALWAGSNSQDFFETDATLRYPLGYRNAEAAFFLIALWPMLGLAASRSLHWGWRAALTASATVAIELVVLSQSRAAPFAAAIALIVLLSLHPARLRTLMWFAAVVVPAAIAVPWLLDVFQSEGGNTAASIPPLHAACRAMAATGGLSLVGGALLARFEPELDFGETGRAVGRWVMVGVVAVALIAGGAVVMAHGGPGKIADRVDNELSAGTPDLGSQGSRFGIDLRSSRGDYWRNAWDDFKREPLRGDGSGGFRHSYLLHRPNDGVQPEDPHSIEMLMLSELGLPGFLLFAAFVGGTLVAVLRARRVGPEAAALVAVVLAAAAYWLIHASVDWFWSYPAVTAPVAFGLGAAAAPVSLRADSTELARPWRLGVAVAAGLIALSLVPFFLSQTYANRGIRTGTADPEAAYADLRRAADLDPLTTLPLLGEAYLAKQEGDRARALRAVDEAEGRTPDDWQPYYLEALLVSKSDPARARTAIERARQLNPVGADVIALAKRLKAA
jgi:O-antigen ligase